MSVSYPLEFLISALVFARALYVAWVVRFRWPILFLTLLWVFALANGGRFLQFKTDYRVFFSKDNPQLPAFDALERAYTKNDNLLFVVTPRDGRIFTPHTLAALEELTEAAWQIPYSIGRSGSGAFGGHRHDPRYRG